MHARSQGFDSLLIHFFKILIVFFFSFLFLVNEIVFCFVRNVPFFYPPPHSGMPPDGNAIAVIEILHASDESSDETLVGWGAIQLFAEDGSSVVGMVVLKAFSVHQNIYIFVFIDKWNGIGCQCV